MKYLTLTGIVLLFSFAPTFRKEARHSFASVQKAVTEEPGDTLPADATIDSLDIFKLLGLIPNRPYKVLHAIDPEYATMLSDENVELTLWSHHKDFYRDPSREIVLHFHTDDIPLDVIYVLTKTGKTYRISEPLIHGDVGAVDDTPALIDFENRCVLLKGRMWGTCTGGYTWQVHRFSNGKFKHVLSFTGEQGSSTCGEQDPEEAWQIESRYAFYDPDAILFTGILVHETFRRDDEGEVIHLGKELVNITMRYRYDAIRDTFLLENNNGTPLASNPIWASEFWEMHEKKEF